MSRAIAASSLVLADAVAATNHPPFAARHPALSGAQQTLLANVKSERSPLRSFLFRGSLKH
jgi:hypothetical protein